MFKAICISSITGLIAGAIVVLLVLKGCDKPVAVTVKDQRLDSVVRSADSTVVIKNKIIDSATKASVFWQRQYDDIYKRLIQSQSLVKIKIDSLEHLSDVFKKYKLAHDTASQLQTCGDIVQMLDDLITIHDDAMQKSDSAKKITDSLINSKDTLIVQLHSENLTLLSQVQALKALIEDIKKQLAATDRKLNASKVEGWIEKAVLLAALIYGAAKK